LVLPGTGAGGNSLCPAIATQDPAQPVGEGVGVESAGDTGSRHDQLRQRALVNGDEGGSRCQRLQCRQSERLPATWGDDGVGIGDQNGTPKDFIRTTWVSSAWSSPRLGATINVSCPRRTRWFASRATVVDTPFIWGKNDSATMATRTVATIRIPDEQQSSNVATTDER